MTTNPQDKILNITENKIVIQAAKSMDEILLEDLDGNKFGIPYSQAGEFSNNLRNRVNGEKIVEAEFNNKTIRIPKVKVDYVAQSIEEAGMYGKNFPAHKRTF